MVPIPVAAVLERVAPAAVVAELPACAGADLSVAFDREGGTLDGPGRSGTLMVVRNIGVAPCRVTALPALSFAGPDGTPLPIRFRAPPGLHPGPVVPPVGIAPGAEATARLSWTSGGASPGSQCLAPATVTVSFGAASVAAPFAARICGPAGGALAYGQAWLRVDARLRP